MAKKEAVQPFKKISELEYEVQVNGRTKVIKAPFELVSLIFKSFISNGGIINPVTGEIETDILTLVCSFKEVGNILLTDYDEEGRVVKEGNCSTLSTKEVISLFQLACELIQGFIGELTEMKQEMAPAVPNENEKAPTETA